MFPLSFTTSLVTILLISSCTGTRAALNETWTLAQLVSKGERTETYEEFVEVENCGLPESKSTNCTAGTENNLSVNFGAGFGSGISLSAGVSSELGFGRSSGEELHLEPPPDGTVYIYKVEKRYKVIAGEVLARSTLGNEQTVTYAFQANCSITVQHREAIPCIVSENNQPTNTKVPPVSITISPQNTPTQPVYTVAPAQGSCNSIPNTRLPVGNYFIPGSIHIVELWRPNRQTPWEDKLVKAIVHGDLNIVASSGSVWTYSAGCAETVSNELGSSSDRVIIVTEEDLRVAGMIR